MSKLALCYEQKTQSDLYDPDISSWHDKCTQKKVQQQLESEDNIECGALIMKKPRQSFDVMQSPSDSTIFTELSFSEPRVGKSPELREKLSSFKDFTPCKLTQISQ